MMKMGHVAAIAFYGFLRNFAPDSQYFSTILTGPMKNLTVTETTQEIYPVAVYCNLGLTLLALLVTDILRYKPVIVVGAFSAVLSKLTLCFGTTVFHMQIMEVFYAVLKSSGLAYKTFLYSQVGHGSYLSTTAVVAITPKAGLLLSSLTAQVIMSWHLASLHDLVMLSILAYTMAFFVAVLLPPIQKSTELPKELDVSQTNLNKKVSVGGRPYEQLRLMWQEFRVAYTDLHVVKWCVWWVLSTGATQLVVDYYAQALWIEVSGKSHNEFNGGVEAFYLAVTGVCCYLIGNSTIDWHRHGDLVLGIVTLVRGGSLLVSAYSESILWCYALYISYCTLYDTMMVVCVSQVALQLKNENFGLIFGINTLLSLVLQSALTYFLTSKNCLALAIRAQFISVGWCFVILGFGFLAKAINKKITSQKKLTIKSVSVANGEFYTSSLKIPSICIMKS